MRDGWDYRMGGEGGDEGRGDFLGAEKIRKWIAQFYHALSFCDVSLINLQLMGALAAAIRAR